MIDMFERVFLPLVVSFLVGNVMAVLGAVVLRLIGVRTELESAALRLGIVMLLGGGLLSYVTLTLAAFGPLAKVTALVLLGAIVAAGWRSLAESYRAVFGAVRRIRNDWTAGEWALGVLVLGGVLFYALSAFVPPYRTDALSYHLPEAMSIATGGLHLPAGTSKFFGNLPLLMEVLYALMYAVGGFTTVHLGHYTLLLSGLLAWFGMLATTFGRRTALLAILLIFTLYELFVDGTNAYVDAAEVSFEISCTSVLLVWLRARSPCLLIVAGMLSGFALAVKYNALYGAALAGGICVVGLATWAEPWPRRLLALAGYLAALLAACGFWYGKNLLWYGNPVYPFHLGHPGFTDVEYESLTSAIQQFKVARTPANFLLLPFHFLTHKYFLAVFAGFMLWPVALCRRNLPPHAILVIRVLSAYALIYAAAWFFSATHQLRFFFVPMIFILTLLAGTAAWLYDGLVKRVGARLPAIAVGAAALVFAALVATARGNYMLTVKRVELMYILGRQGTKDFYREKGLGHVYAVSRYLNGRWSGATGLKVWEIADFFLVNGNRLVGPQALFYSRTALTPTVIDAFLAEHRIQFVVIDGEERRRRLEGIGTREDPSLKAYVEWLRRFEQLLLGGAKPAFEYDDSQIFEISAGTSRPRAAP